MHILKQLISRIRPRQKCRQQGLNLSLALAIGLSCWLPILPVQADSPATSTPFYQAYLELAPIQQAAETQLLSPDLLTWLLDEGRPLDQQLALVNALGWRFESQQNHTLYAAALQQKYRRPPADGGHLRPQEQLLLGYLMLMDDYFTPRAALPLIRRGARRLWQSQAAQLVLAIAEAQDYIDKGEVWCQVWVLTERGLNPRLNADLREAARREITDYLQLYRPYCP
ncbi:MAG: hypothetical protein IGS03_00335 [Candidatus Sericytochromatia bacterium]|nr:hypothetical protein [Candidatus Sericytochromatia bacterium]